MNLRIPGPTPVPDDILSAVGKPMINHRGPEFSEMVRRVTDRLKQAFQTKGDILILTASGTGAMEAAITNLFSPGDKVLSVSIGYFGDRFSEIARAYGARVQELNFRPWGIPADPEKIRQALQADPEIKGVLVTHNETSTGVTNDLKAIAQVVKGEFNRLLVVDAISSLGSIPLPVDEWRCDVVATASQKGWMTPPGLAMVSVSQQAWEASAKATMPRYYFDFASAKRYLSRGQTPATPAVSILYGLDVALERMLKEGMDRVFERHARIARRTRDGVKALGLSLLPDERYASNTVTAVKVPEGVDARKIIDLLQQDHNVVVAGGQGPLDGEIIRIGHLGYVTDQDIDQTLAALQKTLAKLGLQPARARV